MSKRALWVTAAVVLASLGFAVSLLSCSPLGNFGMGPQSSALERYLQKRRMTSQASKEMPPLIEEFDRLAPRQGPPDAESYKRLHEIGSQLRNLCPPGYCLDDQLLQAMLLRFSQIAEWGAADAQEDLGYCYANGFCSKEKDFDKARYWFRKLAAQGQPFPLHQFESRFDHSQDPAEQRERERIVASARQSLPAALKSGDRARFEEILYQVWYAALTETCGGEFSPYLLAAAQQGKVPWPARQAECSKNRALQMLDAHQKDACLAEIANTDHWMNIALAQKQAHEALSQSDTLAYTDLKKLLEMEAYMPELRKCGLAQDAVAH